MNSYDNETDAIVAAMLGFVAAARRKVRQCECGRFFVRDGKRIYCSPQCGNRVRWARFIANGGRDHPETNLPPSS